MFVSSCTPIRLNAPPTALLVGELCHTEELPVSAIINPVRKGQGFSTSISQINPSTFLSASTLITVRFRIQGRFKERASLHQQNAARGGLTCQHGYFVTSTCPAPCSKSASSQILLEANASVNVISALWVQETRRFPCSFPSCSGIQLFLIWPNHHARYGVSTSASVYDTFEPGSSRNTMDTL